MGKVGDVHNGLIDWSGEPIKIEDNKYYNEIITIRCGNTGCEEKVFTTQYEYDINRNDVFCLDCLERYGPTKAVSINILEILNDPNGVHKCINNFKHDVSILSDYGCFECSINNLKQLQAKQSYYNDRRIEQITMGTPKLTEGILFRSKSESTLYSQLKNFDSDLLYEMLYIKVDGETEYYNPDFYLPNLNLFIEYRGYNTDSDKEKRQWKKTYAFANKIKSGLKTHLTWNSKDVGNWDFCKFLIIAPKGIRYFEKGKNQQSFSYKFCSHCNHPTSFLEVFGNLCFYCGK